MGLSKEQLNNRKRSDKLITHREFIKAWLWAYNSNRTLNDIATRLGTSRRHVYSRACWLRNVGVNLPKFRERNWIDAQDIGEFNNMIEEETDA